MIRMTSRFQPCPSTWWGSFGAVYCKWRSVAVPSLTSSAFYRGPVCGLQNLLSKCTTCIADIGLHMFRAISLSCRPAPGVPAAGFLPRVLACLLHLDPNIVLHNLSFVYESKARTGSPKSQGSTCICNYFASASYASQLAPVRQDFHCSAAQQYRKRSALVRSGALASLREVRLDRYRQSMGLHLLHPNRCFRSAKSRPLLL